MSRVDAQKHASLTVHVPEDLKDAFDAAVAMADRSPDEVMQGLMQAYVDRPPQPEEGYDEWFRQSVQESIDDPRPSIPHDVVMKRTTALIDRIVAGKARREN